MSFLSCCRQPRAADAGVAVSHRPPVHPRVMIARVLVCITGQSGVGHLGDWQLCAIATVACPLATRQLFDRLSEA
jgi:hypothetical protein